MYFSRISCQYKYIIFVFIRSESQLLYSYFLFEMEKMTKNTREDTAHKLKMTVGTIHVE